MKRILQSATALAALAAAAPAFATEGWYGRVDAGWGFAGSIDRDFDSFFIDADGDGFVDDEVFIGDDIDTLDDDTDNGWFASLGGGYAFVGTGWRLEGEVSYHSAETDGFDIFGAAPPAPILGTELDIFDSGIEANVWALMINGYYDFNREGRWSPYLGAGIGAADVNLEHTRTVDVVDVTADPVVVDTFAFRADDDEWAFAWQLMAGVAFQVSDQLAIDVGYRYFKADGADINFDFVDNGFVDPGFGFTNDVDFDQNLLTIGLRWQFQPPAPPPAPYTPPPPPTCPAEQYTAERGKDLAAAMDAAAAQARTCNYGSVTVAGPDSQMPTVRDGLVQRGVPASIINTQPSGAATGPVTISMN